MLLFLLLCAAVIGYCGLYIFNCAKNKDWKGALSTAFLAALGIAMAIICL